jgi:hypothetical protein
MISVNAAKILLDETKGMRSADNLVKQSLLYREFLAEPPGDLEAQVV